MTTSYITCPKCKGNKTIRGMGGVIRDCANCKGKGNVESTEVVDTPVVAVVASSVASSEASNVSIAPDAKIEVQYVAASKSDVTPIAEVKVTPEIKPSVVVGEAPVEAKKPVKPIEQELGEMAGYTSMMIEAIMREPSMKPEDWQRKYSSVILPPLSLPKPGMKYLPDLQSRARFREGVGRSQKQAPRKHDTMKTHDMPGRLEGIE